MKARILALIVALAMTMPSIALANDSTLNLASVKPVHSTHRPGAGVMPLSQKPLVVALNRTQAYYGMNPQTVWWNNLPQRNIRLGFGQLIVDLLGGSTTGFWRNLSISPVASTLNVTVGPTSANTQGSLYQYLADDSTAYGGYPSGTNPGALPADPTQIFVQGLTTSSSSNIGPLAPPGTSGQSIDYLIECQIQTVDTTSTAISVVSSSGVVTNTTGNRDRNDNIVCQPKAGTAATTGTQTPPSADSGWLGIGYVAVPNGASQIQSGWITAYSPWSGFVQASGGTLTSGTISGGTISNSTLSAPTLSGCASGIFTTNGSGAQTCTTTLPVSLGGTGNAGQSASSFMCTNASATVIGNCSGITLPANEGGTGATSLPGAGIAPVYNTSGSLITTSTLHIVYGTVNFSSQQTVTVSLSGSAVFSSASSYVVVAINNNAASGAISVGYNSGSSFVLSYASSQTNGQVYWIAIGT